MDAGINGRAAAGGAAAAPFVLKTYRMVDEPSSDAVIGWGRENNSFVVVDPFAFSQTLLPAHFKHSNFSSFVRQLNTYGFRKVDPDRWEFAHASFLRGQTQLLPLIVRRATATKPTSSRPQLSSDHELAAEVVELRSSQRRIEERLAAMADRLRDTERRPRQMLAFLSRLSGDAGILRRVSDDSPEPKRRRIGDAGAPAIAGDEWWCDGEVFGGDDDEEEEEEGMSLDCRNCNCGCGESSCSYNCSVGDYKYNCSYRYGGVEVSNRSAFGCSLKSGF